MRPKQCPNYKFQFQPHLHLRAFDMKKTEFDVINVNEDEAEIEIYNLETDETETMSVKLDDAIVQDLIQKFNNITDDTFYQVIIASAPYGPKDGDKVGRVISEVKVGKD